VAGPVRGGYKDRMPRATWKGVVLAEADDARCEIVEGNRYFPKDAVASAYLRPSETHTTCPWKGVASYYDVVVDGAVNRDAAWFYPDPKPAAVAVQDRIAFWRDVVVES